MKKVFAITCLLVLLVSAMALAAAEPAAQAPWRFTVKADNGFGMYFMAADTIGIAATGKDGYGVDGTAADPNDGLQSWIGNSAGARGVLVPFGGVGYSKNIQSTRSPLNSAYAAPNSGFAPYTKDWNMKVFNLPGVSVESNYIRLQFFTIAATQLPVKQVYNSAGALVNAVYTLTMVDNKGVAGAPAINTVWNIPIPTVHSTTIPYFTLTLPLRTLSAVTADAGMAEGYDMRFTQSAAVPEPGTVAAALALLAPAGFIFRRRRS